MISHFRPRFSLILLLCFGSVAQTFACVQSDTRWAGTSNTFYIEAPVSCTLSDIASFATVDVLELIDPANSIWLLKANLRITGGGTLVLHGTGIGGDVDELRLLSSNNPVQIIEMNTYWGNFDIASTHITTWDPANNSVDTDTSNGRSFIHVDSLLDSTDTARESRMDIVDSEIDHLGYHAAEAYGLVWKVRGSQAGLYDLVDVFGSLVRSHVHDNYMGYYSYGAYGIQIVDNLVENNESYGIDPHDDSDFLVITGNTVHDNGRHGIICSRRCNDLLISGNEVYNNLHGIMLHREVVNTIVENNYSHDNRDNGIALFESHFNTVRNNTVEYNKEGVRLSLGSHDNIIDGNIIRNNDQNGIYLYSGTDTPETTDGRPKDNVFSNNTVSDNGRLLKIRDSDRINISNNTFTGSISDIEVSDSTAIDIVSNSDGLLNMEIANKGADSGNSEVHLETDRDLTVKVDNFASVRLTNPDGKILDPEEKAGIVTITPLGSEFIATANIIQTSSYVSALPFYATAISGSYQVSNPWFDALNHSWYVSTTVVEQPLAFRLTGLLALGGYSVFRDNVLITQIKANAAGELSFSDVIQPVAKYHYEVIANAAVVLDAAADAYVRDGIYADQNFGTGSELNVKQSGQDYNRIGYVSFPIVGITTPKSAILQLTMATSSADTIQMAVSNVSGAWGETTLTWNTQPTIGAEISNQTVTSTTFTGFSFDVTDAVAAAVASGASEVSFVLTASNSSSAVLRVDAREGDADSAPHLVLDLSK